MPRFRKIWRNIFWFGLLFIAQNSYVYSQAYRAVIPLKLYESVDPERLINQIRDLTTPAFEGRELGTDGNQKAVEWASYLMQKNGLTGAFDKEYRQEFPVAMYANKNTTLRVKGKSSTYGSEFLPAYYSATSSDSAQAIFAGFGFVDDPDQKLAGKTVIMLQAKAEYFAINPTLSEKIPNYHANFRSNFFYQAQWAQKMGAKAVVLLNADSLDVASPTGSDYRFEYPINLPARAHKNQALTPSPYVAPRSLNIPVFYGAASQAKNLLGQEQYLQNWLESAITEQQISELDITVNYSVEIQTIERSFGSNLAGIFFGNWSDKYLLVVSSLDSEGQHPKFGYPYVGANSNGTSLVSSFEMARVLTSSGYTPKYSIIFLSANAHRRQQIGLEEFLANPPVPKNRIAGAIILRNLGSGPLQDSASVHLRSWIGDSLFAEVPRFAAQQMNSPVYVNQFSNYDASNLEAGILHSYGIPSVYIEGGYSSFDGRISDTSDKLNYVKFYRLTQFGLEAIWRYVFSGQPQLDAIQQ